MFAATSNFPTGDGHVANRATGSWRRGRDRLQEQVAFPARSAVTARSTPTHVERNARTIISTPVQVTDLYGRGCVYYFSVSVARARVGGTPETALRDVVSRSARRRCLVVGLDPGSRARRKADSVYSYDVGDLIRHLRHKELTPEQKAQAWNGDLRMAQLLVAAGLAARDEQYDATPPRLGGNSISVR